MSSYELNDNSLVYFAYYHGLLGTRYHFTLSFISNRLQSVSLVCFKMISLHLDCGKPCRRIAVMMENVTSTITRIQIAPDMYGHHSVLFNPLQIMVPGILQLT